jgi:hypothetical protein
MSRTPISTSRQRHDIRRGSGSRAVAGCRRCCGSGGASAVLQFVGDYLVLYPVFSLEAGKAGCSRRWPSKICIGRAAGCPLTLVPVLMDYLIAVAFGRHRTAPRFLIAAIGGAGNGAAVPQIPARWCCCSWLHPVLKLGRVHAPLDEEGLAAFRATGLSQQAARTCNRRTG